MKCLKFFCINQAMLHVSVPPAARTEETHDISAAPEGAQKGILLSHTKNMMLISFLNIGLYGLDVAATINYDSDLSEKQC